MDLCQWKYNGKKTNQIEKVNKIGAYVGLARYNINPNRIKKEVNCV